jgi:hypothetical protein
MPMANGKCPLCGGVGMRAAPGHGERAGKLAPPPGAEGERSGEAGAR